MTLHTAVRIGDFCRTGSGSTPSRSQMERYYKDGDIPWVKSGELREGLISTTEEHVTEVALKETSVKLVPAGAILLAMYGATVGRLAILGVEATTNQAVCHIVPDPTVADTRYLYYAIANQVPAIIAMGVGGAQPNISQGLIKDLQIPLPELPEQRRIAAILDQADALRAKRREALAQLDSLTQSIFIEMFGDPMSGSCPWALRKVADFVAGFESGKSVAADDEDDVTSNFRVLKVSAVTSLEFRSNESKAAPATYQPRSTYFVKNGDLLFSRANTTELIGATAFVTNVPDNLLLSDKLWRFVWHKTPKADPFFVNYLFRQTKFRAEIGRRASGTSGSMKNISQEKVLSIYVALPPIELQQIFGERIRQVEQIKVVEKCAKEQADALFSSLQYRAFRGEL